MSTPNQDAKSRKVALIATDFNLKPDVARVLLEVFGRILREDLELDVKEREQ